MCGVLHPQAPPCTFGRLISSTIVARSEHELPPFPRPHGVIHELYARLQRMKVLSPCGPSLPVVIEHRSPTPPTPRVATVGGRVARGAETSLDTRCALLGKSGLDLGPCCSPRTGRPRRVLRIDAPYTSAIKENVVICTGIFVGDVVERETILVRRWVSTFPRRRH